MTYKKIGLDFHGVINTNPEFFRELINLVRQEGIECHIISGGPEEFIAQYLAEQKINYQNLWCIFDFYEAKKKVTMLADGSFHIDDELWDKAKAEYCRNQNIDVHIDDSSIYGKYFTTPYCQYNPHTKQGIVNGTVIDFSGEVQTALDELWNFL